jgi:outer membrane protein assembly factor BamB
LRIGAFEFKGSAIYNNIFEDSSLQINPNGMRYNSWSYEECNAGSCVMKLVQGESIVGGPWIGGNYWAKPDGTGFSQNCPSTMNKGICDNPYTITADGLNVDKYPLTILRSPAMFRADARRSGDYNSVSGGILPNGLFKWRFSTGNMVFSPTVAHGVIYVSSEDGNLYAINAATGKRKWAFKTGQFLVWSNPAVDWNGTVYIGGYSTHAVYAIDGATGLQKWVSPTGDAIESSPAVADGVVYVGCNDGNLYAFDAANGDQKWTFPIGGRHILSSPAVADGFVYIVGGDGNLHVINTGSHREEWATDYHDWPYTWMLSDPAVVNHIVYTGDGAGNLKALIGDPLSHRSMNLGQFVTGGAITYPPSVADGWIYVAAGSGLYGILLRDPLGGFFSDNSEQHWVFTTPDHAIISGPPAVADGVVYVAAGSKIYAIDAVTGARKWDYKTGGWIESSPAVMNGVVYVGSDDFKLYAIGNEQIPECNIDADCGSGYVCSNHACMGPTCIRLLSGRIICALPPSFWKGYCPWICPLSKIF